MVEAFSGSEKKAEDSLTYYKEIPEPQEKLSNKDRARQRWKILCLVKTSDFQADETARKEKLKERVDEWMSSMVGRMKIPDDTNNIDSRLNEDTDTTSKGSTKTAAAASLDNLIPNGSDYPTSGRSSPNVPKYKEELEELRKKSEQEQMKRIKKRQQLEWEKERLLMLEGKIQITKEHLNDPILKFHHDFKKVEVKAKKSQERKLSQIKAKRKISQNSSRIKVKWSNAMDKLKVKNFMDLNNVNKIDGSTSGSVNPNPDSDPNSEPETETVVANLVYDESQDQLTSSLLDSETTEQPTDVNFTRKKIKHPNPVFQAFDDAKNVDDLYRIAEIWVNPTVYYQLDD